jgi:hypothetical protein
MVTGFLRRERREMIAISHYPIEEIFLQQRDGARCGCQVCAVAVRLNPSSDPGWSKGPAAHAGLAPAPTIRRIDVAHPRGGER